MRTLLASLLALLLVAAAAVPHVHPRAATTGGEECTLCTVRHAAPPSSVAPEIAPVVHLEGEAAQAPGLPPVCGAPLGAVPGQSPPAAA